MTAVQDDIINREEDNEDEPDMSHLGIGVPSMRSEPTNRVYIEKKGMKKYLEISTNIIGCSGV